MKNIICSSFAVLNVLAVLAQPAEPKLVVPIGHTSGITSMDISPNGKFLLTGSKDKTAKLWDWSGHELYTLVGHANEVLAVAFSPKTTEDPEGGKFILTGSSDYTAILRDAYGTKIDSFELHKGPINAVAFSPDGKSFLTGSEDHTARIWTKSGVAPQIFQHSAGVNSVAFSPNGKFILTSCKDHTAVLWKRSGAAEVTFSNGHTAAVLCAVFSPSGDSILTSGADGTAILWNLKGEKIQTFQHSREVRSVAFSTAHGGKKIVTGSSDGTLKIWDLKGAEPQTIKAFVRPRMEGSPGMSGVMFSADGKLLVSSSEREPAAKIFRVDDGQLYQRLRGHTSAITYMALSPDGTVLLTSQADRTAKLWKVMSQEVESIRYAGKPVSVDFSPKTALDSVGGRYILIGSENKYVWMQDLQGNDINSFKQANQGIFSPDGKSILTGSQDGTTQVWDIASKKSVTIPHTEAIVTTLAYAPNGKSFAIGSNDGQVIYWDSVGASPVLFPKSTTSAIYSIAFSPEGQSLVFGGENGLTEIRDLSGKLIKAYPSSIRGGKSIRSVAFSPKSKEGKQAGRYVLRAAGDNAELWEVATNKIIPFSGHTSEVTSVIFSPNRENFMTGSKDGTVKIWNIASGAETATLIALDSIDWVVMHASGLFDASPGAMRLMYYLYGDEMLELKQLKTRFYEPYLFQKILGIKPGGLRPVDGLSDVKLYPEIGSWSITNDTLSVSLIPRSGGIGKVALFLDGQEVLADANPGHKTSFIVDLKPFEGFKSSRKSNIFNLILYNKGGYLQSTPYPLEEEDVRAKDPNAPATTARRSLNDASDKTLENIHLYALVIGTSKYSDEKLNLKYPEKDAEMFADALTKAGKELFKERTVVQLLTTANTDQKYWPRKKVIRDALQEISQKAGPEDILLIYFSGHGLTYKAPSSEESQFYYLTREISSDNLKDEVFLNTQAVAQDSLMDWVRQVKARKRVMIYDACNSGSVVDQMIGVKDLTSDQRKALERINERSGMSILTGSAADKSSYEASTFGHGLLTYSLLNGMIEVAAKNGGDVELGSLFDFVEKDVRQLAKKIGQEQSPEVLQSASYPIGQIKETTGIVLPNELNIILRTNLNTEGADILEVSKAFDTEFEKLAAKKKPNIVFWGDVSSFSGKSFFLGGNYQENGGKITGKANLYQSKVPIPLTSFTFECQKDQLSKEAKRIVADAEEFLFNLR